jgi:glycosyltransferase involved in cell wall biosynthesis
MNLRPSSEQPSTRSGSLLLVSHNFPPLQGAESLLVRNNVVDFHQRGWKVGVVTAPEKATRSGEDQALLENIPAEVEVLRTAQSGSLTRPGQVRTLRFLLRRLETRFLPCPSFFWRQQAAALGSSWIQANPHAIIYSRAPRHVGSLAARQIKQRTGRPWVAHFSDPWFDFSYEGYVHRSWIHWLERRVIADADAVVFPNRPLADKVMAKYPTAWQQKVHVVPHGFAQLQPETNREMGQIRGQPLRVLHTGAFYPVYRTPDTLFQGLAILNRRLPLKGRLVFDCVGDETTCFQPLVNQLGLREIVTLGDSVPYARCQEMIAQADLLVVVDVTFGLRGVFLPTKLIEYFAFQKQVLGIAPPHSAVSQTLAGCGLECPDQDQPEEIALAFEKQLQAWESGSFKTTSATREHMRSYQISQVNAPLHELFISLAAAAV